METGPKQLYGRNVGDEQNSQNERKTNVQRTDQSNRLYRERWWLDE